MKNKCPEGFYCLDTNFFLVFIGIIILAIIWAYYNNNNTLLNIIKSEKQETKISSSAPSSTHPPLKGYDEITAYSTNDNDYERSRIYDPLSPPERRYPYTPPIKGIPINIPTRGYGPDFHQVGILEKTSIDSESTIYDTRPQILALYGKPSYQGSSKWYYYTASDKNGFKIPFSKNGKQCSTEYGCNELYDGDKVELAGYNAKYKVTIYGIDTPKYIPYVI